MGFNSKWHQDSLERQLLQTCRDIFDKCLLWWSSQSYTDETFLSLADLVKVNHAFMSPCMPCNFFTSESVRFIYPVCNDLRMLHKDLTVRDRFIFFLTWASVDWLLVNFKAAFLRKTTTLVVCSLEAKAVMFYYHHKQSWWAFTVPGWAFIVSKVTNSNHSEILLITFKAHV